MARITLLPTIRILAFIVVPRAPSGRRHDHRRIDRENGTFYEKYPTVVIIEDAAAEAAASARAPLAQLCRKLNKS